MLEFLSLNSTEKRVLCKGHALAIRGLGPSCRRWLWAALGLGEQQPASSARKLWLLPAVPAASFLQTQQFLGGLQLICSWLPPWLVCWWPRLWAACSWKSALTSCPLVWCLCFCLHVPLKWWHITLKGSCLSGRQMCALLLAEEKGHMGCGFTLFRVPVLFTGLENCLVGPI